MPYKYWQIVEEIRIPAAKVHRYHITFCLYALYHKCFFPFQITNHSVITTRAQPGGKHDQLIIGLESGFHHFREVLRLLPCFINRNTKRSKSAQVHQQVIYQIFHFSVIVTPQHIAQRNSVLSAQRMIGNESIQPVFEDSQCLSHLLLRPESPYTLLESPLPPCLSIHPGICLSHPDERFFLNKKSQT